MPTTEGYNGAYTGAQVDEAIGAVRNKETTWDEKQDKLIGTQGQVVGFDAEGNAVAQESTAESLKPVLRTATLTISGWSNNSQTVTVIGVVADANAQAIDVSPSDKESADAWGESGVWCTTQGANSLTFTCDTVPSANISLNIKIQEAST